MSLWIKIFKTIYKICYHTITRTPIHNYRLEVNRIIKNELPSFINQAQIKKFYFRNLQDAKLFMKQNNLKYSSNVTLYPFYRKGK